LIGEFEADHQSVSNMPSDHKMGYGTADRIEPDLYRDHSYREGQRHGSAPNYIKAEIYVTDEELAAIRTELLQRAALSSGICAGAARSLALPFPRLATQPWGCVG